MSHFVSIPSARKENLLLLGFRVASHLRMVLAPVPGPQVANGRIADLVRLEDNVAYSDLLSEDLKVRSLSSRPDRLRLSLFLSPNSCGYAQQSLQESNFKQLTRLAQCIIEVLCFYRLQFAGQKVAVACHAEILKC